MHAIARLLKIQAKSQVYPDLEGDICALPVFVQRFHVVRDTHIGLSLLQQRVRWIGGQPIVPKELLRWNGPGDPLNGN